jgi:hemin uptake protein HemP
MPLTAYHLAHNPKGGSMKTISMTVFQADENNVELIQQRTNARSKAFAVSTALSVTATLLNDPDNEIYIKNKDGQFYRVIVPNYGKR